MDYSCRDERRECLLVVKGQVIGGILEGGGRRSRNSSVKNKKGSPIILSERLSRSRESFRSENKSITYHLFRLFSTNIYLQFIKIFLMSNDSWNNLRLRMHHLTAFIKFFIILATLIIIIQLLPLSEASEPLRNPYEILGLSRQATPQEIKRAYKNLAKQWHPDKTDHPAAENKFVEIKRAYELLSDPERKSKFDNYGLTEEAGTRQRQESTHFHMSDPFEELFTGNFKFHYQNRDISFFHKMSITYRTFENIVVSKSFRTPHLILFYSDWCFACLQVEPMWRRLINELEPLGVVLMTAHAEREPVFARRMGVHSLPCLIVALDGRTSVYKESLFSVQKVVEFLRSKFPYKLIHNINNNNVESFLSGWVDNKIRALIFEKRESARLRYLLTAFHHRDRVAFGFVQVGKPETESITTRYKISGDLDTLLLFNENSEKPMAAVSMKDIPSETMHNVIANNKFLMLPRLSNQAMLDSVCPPEWLRPQKRLCAILISQNSQVHDFARHKFRQAAIEAPYRACSTCDREARGVGNGTGVRPMKSMKRTYWTMTVSSAIADVTHPKSNHNSSTKAPCG